VAGCPSESLLERITRKLRDGWKRLIDIPNQPGVPKNGSNTYGYPD
ncbi:protease FtsH-inhibitory lysogeny factor CIII, partial [Escherichia coli]